MSQAPFVEIRERDGGGYAIYVAGGQWNTETCAAVRETLWGARREAKKILARLQRGLLKERYEA